jgi:hypothetical protein
MNFNNKYQPSTKEFNNFLIGVWNEYAGKPLGIQKYIPEVSSFQKEMRIKTRFSLSRCLSEPYFLSNYVNFQLTKRKTANEFWRLSHVLYDAHIALEEKKVTALDWLNWKKEYFEFIESFDSTVLLFVKSEVVKLTLTPP